MRKKLLAIIATLAMVMTMIPGVAFAANGTLSGDGTSASPYLIEDAKDLKAFRDGVNDGTIDETSFVKLVSDIDLGGETWTPIKSFAGEFDGNNHTIKNFHIDAISDHAGFFRNIKAGSGERVHDLTLSNITATVEKRFGPLAYVVSGIVNRVDVKNVTITVNKSDAMVGGFCGWMDWPWINDCTAENIVVNAENGADIIAGFSAVLQKNSNMVFDNNDVKGFKVTVNDTDSNGCGVAGFVGQTQRGWEYPKVTNSDITGIDIVATGLVDVGGFIAWPGAHTTAENCTTQGKIDVTGVTSKDCFAGGFFGNLGWNADLGQKGHKVTGCTADVDITTKVAPAGGFVGSATNSNNSSMYAEFTNCIAKGDITCAEGGTAPVGGFAGDADRGTYDNCTATGKVSGQEEAGGFIGKIEDTPMKYDGRYPAGTRDYLADDITIDACIGSNDVTGAADKTAGMIGHIVDGSKITLNSSKYSDGLPEYNPTELKNPVTNIKVDYSDADKTTGEVVATITASVDGTIKDESWKPTDKANQWQKVFKENTKEIVVFAVEDEEYEVTVDVTNAGLPPAEGEGAQDTDKEAGSKPEENVDTGDHMNVVLPITIAGLALAAAAAVVATRRRES